MTRFSRTFLAAAAAILLAVPCAVVVGGDSAVAQQSNVRSLSGTVTNKAGQPVKGAVVHLKDTKSLSQRSYITSADGQYKFAQLSTSTDYEVWADQNGAKSGNKTLSAFDNKTAASIDLKMPN